MSVWILETGVLLPVSVKCLKRYVFNKNNKGDFFMFILQGKLSLALQGLFGLHCYKVLVHFLVHLFSE